MPNTEIQFAANPLMTIAPKINLEKFKIILITVHIFTYAPFDDTNVTNK